MNTSPANHFFDIRRLAALMKIDAALNRSTLLTFGATAVPLLLVVSAMNILGDYHEHYHQRMFGFALLVGGTYLSSRLFNEVHDPRRGAAWLVIPASVFEKFLARLLLATAGYTALMLAGYFAFALVSEALNAALLGVRHTLFDPFNRGVFFVCALYWVLQAPLMLGSAVFKKHALSKTILTILFGALVMAVVTLAAARLLFGGDIRGLWHGVEALHGLPDAQVDILLLELEKIGTMAVKTGKLFFWILLAPVCWAATYFRLREATV